MLEILRYNSNKKYLMEIFIINIILNIYLLIIFRIKLYIKYA